MGSIYDITIDGTGFVGAAPADGFIDRKTSYAYIGEANDPPNSVVAGRAKARANRRYKTLIMQVHAMCNADVISVTANGAGADTQASSFVIRFEVREDCLITANENSPGTFLTGGLALKRCVARALTLSETRNIEYYDPTVVVGRDIDGSDNAGVARGTVINMETIGALANTLSIAEAAVSVNKIS